MKISIIGTKSVSLRSASTRSVTVCRIEFENGRRRNGTSTLETVAFRRRGSPLAVRDSTSAPDACTVNLPVTMLSVTRVVKSAVMVYGWGLGSVAARAGNLSAGAGGGGGA